MAAMAVLSNRKRGLSSLLDDTHTYDPNSKRICFSSFYSPPPSDLFSPPLPSSSAVTGGDQHGVAGGVAIGREDTDSVIPDLDSQLVQSAFEASGNDLSAIKSFSEPQSISDGRSSSSASAGGQSFTAEKLPTDGPGWVELFVTEMMAASNMEDAKARASKVLGFLEKSIITHAGIEDAQIVHEENKMLKEQIASLLHDNSVLKRAVVIQHERQKDYDLRSQELQHSRQTLSQYQEKIRTLEVNNYALAMHLNQALQDKSTLGCRHPDVF